MAEGADGSLPCRSDKDVSVDKIAKQLVEDNELEDLLEGVYVFISKSILQSECCRSAGLTEVVVGLYTMTTISRHIVKSRYDTHVNHYRIVNRIVNGYIPLSRHLAQTPTIPTLSIPRPTNPTMGLWVYIRYVKIGVGVWVVYG